MILIPIGSKTGLTTMGRAQIFDRLKRARTNEGSNNPDRNDRVETKADVSWPIVSVAKETIPIIGIYAYFMGWVYAYYFFAAFGLRPSRLDIPLYYLIVYAFPVLYTVFGVFLLFMFIVAMLLLHRWRFWSALVLVMMIPVCFHMARSQGTQAAEGQRFADTGERIVFTFRNDAAVHLAQSLVYNNEHQSLRPLIDTNDAYIVFFQPSKEEGVVPGVLVYTIAKADIGTVLYRSAEEITLEGPKK